MQACGTPAWAALSASGMRVLNLPEEIKFVTLLADGDQVGKSAAEAAAHRWTQQGKKVRIAEAPRGKDFNDILTKPAPTGEIKQ
jgi:DNA primase